MSAIEWTFFELRQPAWLLLALQPLVLLLLLRWLQGHRQTAYADAQLLPWARLKSIRTVSAGKMLRFIAMQLAWILFAVAMAGPRYPDPVRQAAEDERTSLMIVVDVSRSMTATDIKPGRLKRVKTELFQLFAMSRDERIGIIVYAGKPHVLVPPTVDRKALQFYTRTIKHDVMPTAGSQLHSAIALANKHMDKTDRKAILLITDGEGIEQTAKLESEAPVFVMGVGTASGSGLADSQGGWLMHDGRPVWSRLNETALQTIASQLGGNYARISDDQADLQTLYQQGIASLSDFSSQVRSLDQSWVELYDYFLIPALLIMLSLSIGRVLPQAKTVPAGSVALVLLCALLLSVNVEASARDKHRKAYQSYQLQDYQQSVVLYSELAGFNARMGEGSSAYQVQDYARAVTQFTEAFLLASTDPQRASALYNLANSFFHLKNYRMSLSTFRDVLRYQPDDAHARLNIKFVASVIESQAEDPFSETAVASRGGRGPRSARVQQNAGGGGDFSIDDRDKKQVGKTTTQDGSSTPDKLGKIISGKGKVELASREVQASKARQQSRLAISLLEARRRVLQNKQDQSQLWKSMFENEEGFPAPLDEAVILPGVDPW